MDYGLWIMDCFGLRPRNDGCFDLAMTGSSRHCERSRGKTFFAPTNGLLRRSSYQ
jgi:hypothetical protein